jgi:hypothetical protein
VRCAYYAFRQRPALPARIPAKVGHGERDSWGVLNCVGGETRTIAITNDGANASTGFL